jgi:phage tail-like protein
LARRHSPELGKDVEPKNLDPRKDQLSRLLNYLPAIFQELPQASAEPLPLGRFLMAFESILLGLPKSRDTECDDLLYQPGFEEILGGAVQQVNSTKLLEGIERYFDPLGPAGGGSQPGASKILDHDRAPTEFLDWLAGWVALSLRDDWTDEHKRKFIANAIRLYKLRGTKKGVMEFIQNYTGDLPVEITETVMAEFQLGVHSRIGEDTILDGGSPFFFKVTLTTSRQQLQKEKKMVEALIEMQKPAHTYFSLELKTEQLQIGKTSTIGKDTFLGSNLGSAE